MNEAGIKTVEVAANAFAFIQSGGRTNAGFLVGEEGVTVVDSLFPDVAAMLMAEIRKVTSKPIRHLINTHHHGDHTLSNCLYLPAAIISHANCYRILQERFQDIIQSFGNRPGMAEHVRGLRPALPDLTFDREADLHIDGRLVQLRYLGKAHTDNDIAVYLPEEKLLFAGDLAFNNSMPAAHNAYITAWVQALAKLDTWEITTVVPGHGNLGSKEELKALRDFFIKVERDARQCFEGGVPAEEAAKQIMPAEAKSWSQDGPYGFPYVVQRLYAEFRGELK